MKYCSDCGSLNRREWMAADARHRWVCGRCGVTHYENPRVVVCSIVSWRQRILFCRRSEDPAKGQWTLPLGYLECGETLMEGAARETFEETGVRVDPDMLELSLILNLMSQDQVVIAFRAALRERPTVTPGKECLEAAFMSERQVAAVQLAWACMAARDFFEALRSESQFIRLLTLSPGHTPALRIREYPLFRGPLLGRHG